MDNKVDVGVIPQQKIAELEREYEGRSSYSVMHRCYTDHRSWCNTKYELLPSSAVQHQIRAPSYPARNNNQRQALNFREARPLLALMANDVVSNNVQLAKRPFTLRWRCHF